MSEKEREAWINSRQAAEHLGLSMKALYRMIQKELIPPKFVHRLGKSLRFKRSELDELVTSGDLEEE